MQQAAIALKKSQEEFEKQHPGYIEEVRKLWEQEATDGDAKE